MVVLDPSSMVVNASELKGGFYFWSGVDHVSMAADRTSSTNCPYQGAYSLGIDAFDAAKVDDDRHPVPDRIGDQVSQGHGGGPTEFPEGPESYTRPST